MISFVIALPCEANPIISYFKLKKLATSLPIFSNQDQTVNLIISGVGKIKMAVATAYLAAFTNNNFTTFLNIGIAGSRHYSIGQSVIANKITEFSSSRNWYPYVPLLKNIPQDRLITYGSPQTEYPSTGMVDMEGSSFFQAASTFVTQEQIQILKIISDNQAADQEKISNEFVRQLVSDNIDKIKLVADYLSELSLAEQSLTLDPPLLNDFKQQWHFTHSQFIQLKEYLRRWYVCCNQDPFIFCKNEKTSAQVIKKIMNQLETTKI